MVCATPAPVTFIGCLGAKAKMEEVLEELDSTSEICGVSSSELRSDLQPLFAEFQRMMGPEKPDHRRSGLAFIK